jgi:hypothetical protein
MRLWYCALMSAARNPGDDNKIIQQPLAELTDLASSSMVWSIPFARRLKGIAIWSGSS